jgi:hypothetical protein
LVLASPQLPFFLFTFYFNLALTITIHSSTSSYY